MEALSKSSDTGNVFGGIRSEHSYSSPSRSILNTRTPGNSTVSMMQPLRHQHFKMIQLSMVFIQVVDNCNLAVIPWTIVSTNVYIRLRDELICYRGTDETGSPNKPHVDYEKQSTEAVPVSDTVVVQSVGTSGVNMSMTSPRKGPVKVP